MRSRGSGGEEEEDETGDIPWGLLRGLACTRLRTTTVIILLVFFLYISASDSL